MSRNGSFRYLHGDHLGGTVLGTNSSGTATADQKYYAGACPERSRRGQQRDSGPVTTDHKFTGQKLDGTGLMYYSARYYNPSIGAFISPDTIVPDPGLVADYNRYMMVRGNPLRYNDPTGHHTTTFDQWGGGGGFNIDSRTMLYVAGRAVTVALLADLAMRNAPSPSIPSAPDMPLPGYSTPAVDTSVPGVSLGSYSPQGAVTTGTDALPGDPGFTLGGQEIGDNVYAALSTPVGRQINPTHEDKIFNQRGYSAEELDDIIDFPDFRYIQADDNGVADVYLRESPFGDYDAVFTFHNDDKFIISAIPMSYNEVDFKLNRKHWR